MRSLLPLTLLMGLSSLVEASTLEFAGRTWHVRDEGRGAPGPNAWAGENAWVDAQGRLHLRIDRAHGRWRAAEVRLAEPLGLGTYEFRVVGSVDRLDPNVVLGLFGYPEPATGPDHTHEIDIELSRWGRGGAPAGRFTVYPTVRWLQPSSRDFQLSLEGDHSTYRIHRGADSVRFQVLHGHRDGDDFEAARWTYAPRWASRRISTAPLSLRINLWLFMGQPPQDGQPVEVVISDFRFTPAP